jgi:cell fate regulator YaaT (PSP1 superfamily)
MNNSRLAGVKFYKKDKTSLVEISSNFRETLNINDYVIVKFENSSTDLAQIIFLNDENKNKAACKCGIKINATIIKRAENSDIETRKYLDESEKKAIEKCSKLIEKHNLKMFLLDAHYMIDKSKITFYFSAESRIDFRELVKELASSFKTRIELLQVGIRDECKRLGGLGICGQETCCSKFLYNFTPVSIKMAKNQMLNLTPNKISGICGRLMCCLS